MEVGIQQTDKTLWSVIFDLIQGVCVLGDFKLGKEATEKTVKGLNLTPGPGELTAKR